MYLNSENRGRIQNLQFMTKKKSSEILTDENRKKFWEKIKFYTGSSQKLFRKYGGNLKQGGKCIIASDGWTTLLLRCRLRQLTGLLKTYAYRPKVLQWKLFASTDWQRSTSWEFRRCKTRISTVNPLLNLVNLLYILTVSRWLLARREVY